MDTGGDFIATNFVAKIFAFYFTKNTLRNFRNLFEKNNHRIICGDYADYSPQNLRLIFLKLCELIFELFGRSTLPGKHAGIPSINLSKIISDAHR